MIGDIIPGLSPIMIISGLICDFNFSGMVWERFGNGLGKVMIPQRNFPFGSIL